MHFYSLSGYASMVAVGNRWEVYRQAMAAAIRPGATVVEIGTGPGLMAIVACQQGAGRVIAIEPNEVVQVAREIVGRTPMTERITWVADLSTRVEPAIPGDVLVSDLRGVLPLFEHHISTIVDARRRWLKPGGIQIPAMDRIHGALVEAPSVYEDYDGPWRTLIPGVDLEAARRRTINTTGKTRVKPEQLLSEAQLWATLDYRTIEDPNVGGSLRLSPDRQGAAHGLVMWFDTDLYQGIGFSNAPGGPENSYGHKIFPFEEPLSVAPGDEVVVDLRARLVADDYVWSWATEFKPGPGSAAKPQRFRQSTFLAEILSPEKLRRRGHDFVPKLNADGQVELAALQGMTGGQPLQAIAESLVNRFPGRFKNVNEALAFVGELSVRFGG